VHAADSTAYCFVRGVLWPFLVVGSHLQSREPVTLSALHFLILSMKALFPCSLLLRVETSYNRSSKPERKGSGDV